MLQPFLLCKHEQKLPRVDLKKELFISMNDKMKKNEDPGFGLSDVDTASRKVEVYTKSL